MKRTFNGFILFSLFVFCTTIVQAHPEFARLLGVQSSLEDPFEFHLPSPLDYIKDSEIETLPDLSRFRNLESKTQDFVLETKQFKIPRYEGSFNPTIVRWRGSLLMAFRVRDTTFNDKIAMVWLDDDFEVRGTPYILEIPPYGSTLPSKKQDPRLLVIGDTLHMVYSNVLKGVISPEVRRVFHTHVHFDGIRFYADHPEGIFSFEGEKEQRWEKNWSPFEYNGELFLENSLYPHRVFRPLYGTSSCETVGISEKNIEWKWGHLRGGTQSYLVDYEYLSFFHSSISMKTQNSLGKEMPHYVFGAYTFSPAPPFHITRISPEPIIGKGFYSGPPYKTWKPLRVVFPGGYVIDDKYIWVVFGKQDHEMWVTKLDRKRLMESLIPVEELGLSHGK